MRRQLAILSGLWFVLFCSVYGALTLWAHERGALFEGMGGWLPSPTRIIVGHTQQPWAIWSIVVIVACLNVVLLRAAYRMREQRAARIFHRWALWIQAIALILFACFVVIALFLPFFRLVPVIK